MARVRRIVFAVAAIAALAGAVSLAQASIVGVPSKVTIENGPPAFHGEVKSDRDKCERHRKVRMFLRQDGPDQNLGGDRTNRHGRWTIEVMVSSGAYYAKVKPKAKIDENGNGVICHKDRSRLIIID